MSFLPPYQQRQSPEGNIKSTNPNHWSDLILSSPTTGLLTYGALLPLHGLSDASISAYNKSSAVAEMDDRFATIDTG